MRYLLYLTQDDQSQEIQYLIDRKNDYWYVPKDGLHFPVPRDMQAFHINSLIDGELVMNKKPNGEYQPTYLVFDCMVLDGNSLMSRPLDKRIAYFQDKVFKPYRELLREYPEEEKELHFLVELKKMEFSYSVEHVFLNVLPKLPHGNDGLIFTCVGTEYKPGTDPHILKWKPENENSVDFRLCLDFPLVQPDEVDMAEGISEPYLDYDAIPVCNLHVYAGDGREDPWYSTMFTDPDQWESLKSLQQPLDDRIVECYMDDKKRWRYMRFRDDKTNANHTTTVESVIESITDRVTKKDLKIAAQDWKMEWKRRAADELARDKKQRIAAAQVAAGVPMSNGTKRKAEEQGNGRPSPAPPGKQDNN
jgi:mRNA guanylyltransferase